MTSLIKYFRTFITSSKLLVILSLLLAMGCKSISSEATTKEARGATTISKQFIESADAKLEDLSEGDFKLSEGGILNRGRKAVNITTPLASLSICAGAISLIEVREKIVRVLNISAIDPHCVKIVVDGKTLHIGAGRELMIVQGGAVEAHQDLCSTNLRRRHLKTRQLDNGCLVLETEVSLLDAVIKEPLLVNLAESSSGEDRSLMGRITKIAATLSTVDSSEPFLLPE